MAVAIACEVAATLSLKAALYFPVFYVIVGAGYLSAFVCLDRVLRLGMPIGVAYGLWGAIGVVATAVLSWLFFGEALSWTMAAGIVLIVVGVLCIELGGRGLKEKRE
ncbi:DMT family transporter [Corynebacterium tapiri]|uniref:DMT family transporter n=1 Tax=Corynebacterium tapiri TaxID=1448266 RepID=UPI001FED0C2E|nr:SMR family transporter [Corynebacterium tapiri]